VAGRPGGAIERRVAAGAFDPTRGPDSDDEAVHLMLIEPRSRTSLAESPSGARPSAFLDNVPGVADS